MILDPELEENVSKIVLNPSRANVAAAASPGRAKRARFLFSRPFSPENRTGMLVIKHLHLGLDAAQFRKPPQSHFLPSLAAGSRVSSPGGGGPGAHVCSGLGSSLLRLLLAFILAGSGGGWFPV